MIKNIEIYTKNNCPYCQKAKKLLTDKKILFNEINIDNNDILYQEMISRCKKYTVPQIFFDNKHIGGFDDLNKLDILGKLDALLKIKIHK